MRRWFEVPWTQPNNSDEIFSQEAHQQALRAASKLSKIDPEKAFQEFLNLAEQGSVWAMARVGYALLFGQGIPLNKAEGEKWLLHAQEVGNEWAMLILANEYLQQKRYTDAEMLLSASAKKDYSPALYLLGSTYFKIGEKAKARKMLERAAALGHHRAKGALAKGCCLGRFGLASIPDGFRFLNEISDEVKKNEAEPPILS
ncbi:MAG: sel1 repeat family protein [Rhodospirillales bacterium]|nr:sel1 repeat family protein [Rhodospirillales bacterium]